MKVTSFENYRVEVQVHFWNFGGRTSFDAENLPEHHQRRETLEIVLRSIKRHVDDVQHMRVTWDKIDRCSLCGDEWETCDGMPQCCNDALDEWEAAQTAPQTAQEPRSETLDAQAGADAPKQEQGRTGPEDGSG